MMGKSDGASKCAEAKDRERDAMRVASAFAFMAVWKAFFLLVTYLSSRPTREIRANALLSMLV
jgi:hypothetical protein